MAGGISALYDHCISMFYSSRKNTSSSPMTQDLQSLSRSHFSLPSSTSALTMSSYLSYLPLPLLTWLSSGSRLKVCFVINSARIQGEFSPSILNCRYLVTRYHKFRSFSKSHVRDPTVVAAICPIGISISPPPVEERCRLLPLVKVLMPTIRLTPFPLLIERSNHSRAEKVLPEFFSWYVLQIVDYTTVFEWY